MQESILEQAAQKRCQAPWWKAKWWQVERWSIMSETDDKKINIKSTIRDSNTEAMSGIESVSSVHVDRAMVAVDHSSKTATISLLTMHAIPKFSNKFDIENFTWKLVGELKVPFNVMDAL